MLTRLSRFLTGPNPDHPQPADPWSPNQWLLFWFVWSLLLSAIYWVLGAHSYLRIQDNADFNLPYRIAAARDLLNHGLTYWQPKFSGGMPSLVHPMVDNFLIDGVPYLLFPAWAVHGFVMWLQRFVAGYFTFRLCREILRLDAVGSLFAGLAFSLYLWGVQDIRLLDALGLPAVGLTFYLFDRLLKQPLRRSLGWALLMGITLALISQSLIHTVFLVGALPFWLLIVRQVRWSTLWPRFGAFATGAILLEAPLFITLLIYSPTTTRGQIDPSAPTTIPSLTSLAEHAWKVIGWHELPQNGLYLGLFALGLVAARTLDKGLAWRLLALFLLAGVGSEVGYWLQFVLHDYIPPSRGNLLDFNQFTIFLGPLLGGMGLHLLRAGGMTANRMTRSLIVLVTLFALSMPLLNWKKVTRLLMLRIPTDNYAINFENPVLQQLGTRQKTSTTPFRVASIGTWPPTVSSASGGRIYPAYAFAYGLESVDGYYRLHSARYHHFWTLIIAKTLQIYPEQRERTLKWYYLFMPPQPRFADRKPLRLDDRFNLELLSLANTRYLISHWPLEHPALTLIHDPVQELAKGREWEGLRTREQIWRTLQGDLPHHALYVYENQSVLPRAFMTRQVRTITELPTLLETLATTPVSALRQTALLETPVTLTGPGFSHSEITWEQYTPDHMQLTTHSDGPGLLVITNNFDPYWQVRINGQKGEILPVYHTFQGILLNGGTNQVVLDYWPPYR